MENKVLVQLSVPNIDEEYDLFIPINMRVGEIIILIEKTLKEFTNDLYVPSGSRRLYNCINGYEYDVNDLVRKTDIRNGTRLILA